MAAFGSFVARTMRRSLAIGNQHRYLTSSAQEKSLADILRTKLEATKVNVADISGGCGAMFNVEVESPLFKGKKILEQHRLVKEALAEDIKKMHGLSISTKISPE